MPVIVSGRMRVSVNLVGDDRFVFRGNVIDEVWFTTTTAAVRSNTVWFKGVDFYGGQRIRGRMRVDDLPQAVRAAMGSAVEGLRSLAP